MDSTAASSTAYTVMQGILATARNPAYAPLFDAETKATIRRFLSTSEEGQRRLQQLENPLRLASLRLLERIMAPNIGLHYALRKKFFYSNVEKYIHAGAKQIVSIGAGFDLLAYEMHRIYPEVQFVEIDHPSTSREKRAMISALGSLGPNLSLLAFDLTQDGLYSVMTQQDVIKKNTASVFICEGVFMYLDSASVTKTFTDVQKIDPSATFLFTALAPMDTPENNATWLLKTYLRIKNEPLDWCVGPREIENFLQVLAFRPESIMDDARAHQAYLGTSATKRLHRGEYMVAAVSDL